jgi:hypothetical protein
VAADRGNPDHPLTLSAGKRRSLVSLGLLAPTPSEATQRPP